MAPFPSRPTLQVVLEPGDPDSITAGLLSALRQACYRRTTYLDRFYSILPGPMRGSKRLVVLLEADEEARLDADTAAAIDEFATVAVKAVQLS